MFKKTKQGFDIELNGHLVSCQFGPISQSDNANVSPQAFNAGGGNSRDAHIIVNKLGELKPIAIDGIDMAPDNTIPYATPETFAEVLAKVAAL